MTPERAALPGESEGYWPVFAENSGSDDERRATLPKGWSIHSGGGMVRRQVGFGRDDAAGSGRLYALRDEVDARIRIYEGLSDKEARIGVQWDWIERVQRTFRETGHVVEADALGKYLSTQPSISRAYQLDAMREVQYMLDRLLA